MVETSPSPLSQEKIAGFLSVPLHRILQPQIVSCTQDDEAFVVDMTFTTSDILLTPTGTLHGGSIYLMNELAGVIAIYSNLSPDTNAVTIDHHSKLVGNVVGANVQVETRCRLVKQTKRFAYLEAHTFDTAGKLLATSQITKALTTTKPKSKL